MLDRNTRVLIVDDQHDIHIDFQEILNQRNRETDSDDLAEAFLPVDSTPSPIHYRSTFELSHAFNGDEAYRIVKAAMEANRPFAVAYIDIRMPPGIDGIEAVRRIRMFDKNLEIVIMTAYTDRPVYEIAMDMEPLHKLLYIRKPIVRVEIQQLTLSLVEKWNLEAKLISLTS